MGQKHFFCGCRVSGSEIVSIPQKACSALSRGFDPRIRDREPYFEVKLFIMYLPHDPLPRAGFFVNLINAELFHSFYGNCREIMYFFISLKGWDYFANLSAGVTNQTASMVVSPSFSRTCGEPEEKETLSPSSRMYSWPA